MTPEEQKVIAAPSCAQVLARLSEYLDGDLPPAEDERIAAHLAGCDACARLARELGVVVLALHAHLAGAARVPGVLRERLRQAVAGKPC